MENENTLKETKKRKEREIKTGIIKKCKMLIDYKEINEALKRLKEKLLKINYQINGKDEVYWKAIIIGYTDDSRNQTKLREVFDINKTWTWDKYIKTDFFSDNIMFEAKTKEEVMPTLEDDEIFLKYGFPYFVYKIDQNWIQNDNIDKLKVAIDHYESVVNELRSDESFIHYFVDLSNLDVMTLNGFKEFMMENQKRNYKIKQSWIEHYDKNPHYIFSGFSGIDKLASLLHSSRKLIKKE